MITPQELHKELGAALEIDALYLKREDLHPYESHKGRSIPVMIESYIESGKRQFAISSSGNAAIAAAHFVKEYNKTHKEPLTLQIFIGNHVNPLKEKKLESIADQTITITRVERPLQSLFSFTQDGSVQGLRQSNDDTALLGYEALAKELKEIKNLKAVFIPTSSGTAAQALSQALGNNVEMHIVQTMSCHPIADNFTEIMQTDEESIADAIVDKTAYRKDTLADLITSNGGNAYIATNDEIKTAIELVKTHTGIEVSPNGALGIVGLMQAIYTGKKWDGPIACIITGK